uniref:Protein YIPF n=1 Tax=Syphacia muris TaxID=451379 RepID=A0A0N5AW30_9BILA
MDSLKFQDFNLNSEVPQSNGAEFQPSTKVYPSSGETSSEGKDLSSKKNFFSFEFYQQYFDVDTEQVLMRILNSMVPRFGSNFIVDHVQPVPDLYGPVWISITLVFMTAICGNLAKYIETSGDVQNETYSSDFRLITGASTLIACYVILIPFALYTLFWYRKSELQYSYLELFCAYGYSLSIFVPVSILWVINIQLFRWLLIVISVLASGTVLMSSIWPALKTDRNRFISFGAILGVLLLHCFLAVTFKEYYFDASQSERSMVGAAKIQATTEVSSAQTVIKEITRHV